MPGARTKARPAEPHPQDRSKECLPDSARTLVLVQPSQGTAMGGGSSAEGNLDTPGPQTCAGRGQGKKTPLYPLQLPECRHWRQVLGPVEGGCRGKKVSSSQAREGENLELLYVAWQQHDRWIPDAPGLPSPLWDPHQQRAPWSAKVHVLLSFALWWPHGLGPEGSLGSIFPIPLQGRAAPAQSKESKGRRLRSPGSEPTLPSKVGLVMPRTAPVREYSLWAGLRVWLFYTHPVPAVLLFHVPFTEHTRTQGGMASHPRSPSKEMVIPGRPDSSPRLPSPLCGSNSPSMDPEPFPPRPQDTQRG